MTPCIDHSRAGLAAAWFQPVRQAEGRRAQVGRRAGKVWRVLSEGTAPIAPRSRWCNGRSRPRAKSTPGAPRALGSGAASCGGLFKTSVHGDRGSTGYNPTLGVDPRSPCTSAPPSGRAGPKSAAGDPLTRPKRPCGGRTGRRVGPTCTARPDLPANTPPVGRSGLAVHVGPRGAAPRAAAPSRDALLGVFTLEKALSKNTGGGGGPGGARPWVG